MKSIELKPIKESPSEWDALEAEIKKVFKREIYFPILALLGAPKNTIKNASGESALAEALRAGRVTFYRGQFKGRFSSAVSKELRGLGAQWEANTRTWRLPQASLPVQAREAIATSEARFQKKLESIDKKLAQILPEEIAGQVKASKHFDSALWKVEAQFRQSVHKITIAPKLSPEQAKKISDEWQNNMELWISKFSEEEIKKLRKEIKEAVFTGDRYESSVKTIQKSYDVSANKAKFLARQETSLLMTKFKETRYMDAGVKVYKWGTVAGSKLHPVRPTHKAVDGKYFRWDYDFETDKFGKPKPGGARKPNNDCNPGEDYNCRCFAKPVVTF